MESPAPSVRLSAAAFFHVNAVMVISELERVTVLASVGPDRRGILLHRVADGRQGHLQGVQKVRIVTRPITIVLIDDDGLFRLDSCGGQHFLLGTGTLCALGYYRDIPAVRVWNRSLRPEGRKRAEQSMGIAQ